MNSESDKEPAKKMPENRGESPDQMEPLLISEGSQEKDSSNAP